MELRMQPPCTPRIKQTDAIGLKFAVAEIPAMLKLP